MTLQELMKSIGENNPPKYSIWFGEEQSIVDLYIKQLEKTYVRTSVETVSSAIDKLGRKSLDKRPKMYVVVDDTEYSKAETKWEDVKKMFSKSKDIIILRYNSVNKKNKFYTRNKQDMIEFLHLQPEILTKYIQREIELSDTNCEQLCEMCGNDYGRVMLEVDKIQQYRHDKKKDIFPNDAFRILCEQGAIYKEIGDITFELTDAILGGYVETALQKLDEAKRKGEPAIRIATVLYHGFRNLFTYKALGKNKQNASQRTGLTGWQVKQCIDLDGGYSIQEVKRNMLFCQKVEQGIKSGVIDDSIALEYLTLHCIK